MKGRCLASHVFTAVMSDSSRLPAQVMVMQMLTLTASPEAAKAQVHVRDLLGLVLFVFTITGFQESNLGCRCYYGFGKALWLSAVTGVGCVSLC